MSPNRPPGRAKSTDTTPAQPGTKPAQDATKAPDKPKADPATRALNGIAKVHALVEELVGRMDRLLGTVDAIKGELSELRVAMPEPERWCTPYVDESTSEVYCEGGVRLTRSPRSKDDPKRPEWMHPLEPDHWHEKETVGGGTALTKWHNVYESRTAKSPPPGGEIPWPSGTGDDQRAEAGAPSEPDDLPF